MFLSPGERERLLPALERALSGTTQFERPGKTGPVALPRAERPGKTGPVALPSADRPSGTGLIAPARMSRRQAG
jgi:hypothetical protein